MKDQVNITEPIFIELRVANFKRLTAFRVRPDGAGVVQITGRNDQGKSSALDAFAAALSPSLITAKNPIKKGKTEAEVFVDLGSLRATRTWKQREDGSVAMSLTVELANGDKPTKKQSVLDELRGTDLACDPLEFTRLDSKAQYDALKTLVPGIDFDEIATVRLRAFSERTQVGRDYEREKGAADAINIPQGTPLNEISVSALASQLADAAEHNAKVERAKARYATVEKTIEDKRNEADALMIRAKALEAEADKLETELPQWKPVHELRDVAGLQREIDSAETTNAAVRLLSQQDAHRTRAKAYSTRYDELTAAIAKIDAAKDDAIAKAKLPVKSLTFGDNEILMNGVPFTEASQANKIMVSMAIAMSLKPKLRVILIRDGSLLDSDSMKLVDDMARKNNFVVLLERVATGERIGIVVEDGEVVS